MNILDFLENDHRILSRELRDLKSNLYEPDILERFKKFTGHFMLHENIEEEILFGTSAPGSAGIENFKMLKKTNSSVVTAEFARMLDALSRRNRVECRPDFQRFFAYVTFHMQDEEQSLFPQIRSKADPTWMDEMGLRAEQQFYRLNKSRGTSHLGESK